MTLPKMPVTKPVLLLMIIATLNSCAPNREDCSAIVPVVPDAPATIADTPNGGKGCMARKDGVLIVVEAQRDGMNWKRGRLWINNTEVTEAEFASKLEEARGRAQVDRAIERTRGAVDQATQKAKEFLGLK